MFFISFLLAMFASRSLLFVYSYHLQQTIPSINSLKIFAIGSFYDFCTACYAVPMVLLLARLLPRWLGVFLWCYVLVFTIAAELVFWDEFSTRFNFIAVDYLVYSHEVIKNIYESYPLIWILIAIGAFSAAISCYWLYKFKPTKTNKGNYQQLAILVAAAILVNFTISENSLQIANQYENELAHNGIYNLFAAYKNNRLSYKEFYQTISVDEAFHLTRKHLHLNEQLHNLSISRPVVNRMLSKPYNLILIVVESLNADYMAHFGNQQHLTPFLDKLVNNSVLFTKFYATGTRTVRGLEAITTSLPPLPGNAVIRRPDSKGMFSLGSVLNDAGYQMSFLYGGYGYFDNMNHFFVNNHFSVLDRTSFASNEITFANAWGACDEDLYSKALQQADLSYATNRPFMQLLMTTSNHRPYTYPEGKINIPSGSGRNGAVRYTDYAIEQFFAQAHRKPWFNNTLFVIVADHCAASAGKEDLPLHRYHIPLLIYSPTMNHLGIKPQKISHLSSQIDLAPTLLGLLGINYTSKFYGMDLLKTKPNRSFISTYRKLGFYGADGYLTVLSPQKKVDTYRVAADGQQHPVAVGKDVIERAIANYQTADHLFDKGLLKEQN